VQAWNAQMIKTYKEKISMQIGGKRSIEGVGMKPNALESVSKKRIRS